VIRDRVVPFVLSVLVIVLVAVVQERSRHLGALIATMPVTAPLAMWGFPLTLLFGAAVWAALAWLPRWLAP
jgi:hypothetical protein